jgi:ferritin-like metal-binding protein YciE
MLTGRRPPAGEANPGSAEAMDEEATTGRTVERIPDGSPWRLEDQLVTAPARRGNPALNRRLPFILRSTMEAPMAKAKTLQDLFHDTLKDIYFAEKKILTALPKMARAANSDELRAAFDKHEGETEGQVERLEEVFQILGETPKGKTCDAIVGIIEEGQEIMKEYKGTPALDAGLLAAAQTVEHYEISRYGTLKTWAGELGMDKAVELLDATLAEEKKTDAALTELAETLVNQEAEAA